MPQEFCNYQHPELGPCVYGKAHKLPYHTVNVSDPPEDHGLYTLQHAKFRHFDYAGREVEIDEHGSIIN